MVSVNIKNATKLSSAPFYLMYKPAVVSFVSAAEGGFLKQDGGSTVFMTSNDPVLGRVIVGLSRLADTAGVSGSGTLMTASFKGEQPGVAAFTINNANLTDVNGSAHTSIICGATVTIQ